MTIAFEGINQSGKTFVVTCFAGGHLHIKLPHYDMPVGNYIEKSFLPSVEARSTSLRNSVIAQMSLFAANRLEVLALTRLLKRNGVITEETEVIMDRTPFSNFFTFIDALFNGDLDRMLDEGEIDLGHIGVVNRLKEKMERFGNEAVFDRGDMIAIRVLYAHAVRIIEEIDGLFLQEFFGDGSKIVILDLPAGEALKAQAQVVEEGKVIDVQEGLFIQRIVREMYRMLAEDRENVLLVDQMERGVRLDKEGVLNLVASALGIVVPSSPEGLISVNKYESLDGMDLEVQAAFNDLMAHPCLSEVRAELGIEMQVKNEGARNDGPET